MTKVDRESVAPLVAALSGHLLLPHDDGYELVRRVHNGMIDRRPAVIVRCLGTVDVVDALAFAVESGLRRWPDARPEPHEG
jgi:hypothetical protein